MMRASIFRRSPILLLAAVLVAVGVLFAHAPLAQAAPPGVPTGVSVEGGVQSVTVTWTAPTGTVTGYDMDYTTATKGAPDNVGDDDPARTTDTDYTAGWASIAVSGTSRAIPNLPLARSDVRVRVRATNADGHSAWVHTTAVTWSTNANLASLTASGSDSAGGTFSPIALSGPTMPAPVWSATLNVKELEIAGVVEVGNGCDNDIAGAECSTTSVLSEDAISIGSNAYSVVDVYERSGTGWLFLGIDTDTGSIEDLKALFFCVGTQEYPLSLIDSDAGTASFIVNDAALTVGDAVQLSIRSSCTPSQYTATVNTSVTHVKLTASGADAGWQSLQMGPTGGSHDIVNHGVPSTAFALALGANSLTVGTTAQDSTTQKDYTIVITQQEQPSTTVSLSAAPAVVEEGSSVTVTATLSEAQTNAVTIPVTVTSSTAESGDHGTLTSITIAGGDTAGTGTITTNQDTDTDDELFTVSLGTSLPSGITAGRHSSVGVVIADASGSGAVAATVWTGTLSTGETHNGILGCDLLPDRGANDQNEYQTCHRRFAEVDGQPGNAFDHGGVDYQVLSVFLSTAYHGQQAFGIQTNRRLPENWVLVVDGSTWLSVRDANSHGRQRDAVKYIGPGSVRPYRYHWTWTDVSWTQTGTSTLSYVVPRASVPTVALSASPSTVLEGGTVTVTATLSAAASSAVPLRLRGMLSSITIPAGQTSATATFTAAEDTDHLDGNGVAINQWTEGQFDNTLEVTVNAGTPPGVLTEPSASGFSGHGQSSKSLRIGVIDNDYQDPWGLPTIGLSCYNNHKRNWTNEGEEALVTLRISKLPSGETVIPLIYEHISTEDGDFSGPASVTLTSPPSDAWTGVVTIPEDGDTGEDEQYENFRVSLGTLPGWARPAGSNCVHLIKDPTPDIGIIQNSPVIQADYSDLIARMYGWRNDPDWAHHKSHTDRWDRALLAFGETVEDASLTPMTADEAQAFADKGMTRWVEVARALRQIEAGVQAQGQQQSPPNRAPTVSRTLPDLTIVNESGSRTVSLSDVFSDAPDVFRDADGDSLTLTAAASDEAVATVSVSSETYRSSLTVQAQALGAATITVTADDGNGGTAEESFAVTVKAKPAVARRLADVSGLAVGASQEVSLAGVFRDADGDALTIEALSQNPDIATVSAAADGSALTLRGAARGETGIMVVARDADGNRSGFQFQVTVASPEPANEGVSPEPANVRVAPGDGILTVSWTVSSREGVADDEIKHALRWSQKSGVWANPTDPRGGGPEDGIAVAGGVYSYTITGLENGVATGVFVRSFTGSSHSERSEHSSQWVRTKGEHTTPKDGAPPPATPNQAPTVSAAIADATIVNASGTKEVSLSGVFDDADGDGLTVTAASSDEAKATVSVASDGSSLTVAAKSRGAATITVTASDGNGGTVSDSFTVTVKAAPVVASAIADVSGLAAGSTRDVSLSGVFSDADGDALSVTASSGDEAKATVSVASDGSKLTLAGVGEGTATVTVAAQDTDGNRVSDAFAVSVVAPPPATPNQAPTVSSAIGDATIVNQSGTQQVSLSGVFSDADNDALSVTAASDDEAVATVSVASDGSSLTVAAKSRGTATITVTASDGNGGSVEDSFTVTVKAAPVVASAIADVSGLAAGSTRDVSLSGVFSDADGDSLTITASSSDDAKATVSVASDGSSLTLTGVAEGSATVTVNAQDADGNRVSDAFGVSVVAPPPPATPNQAPTVSAAIADATIVNASGSQQVSLSGVFDDADGDSLSITAASSDEAKATVSVASDGSSLTVAAKSRGTATITVTASDGNGGSVEDSFTVTVKAAPVVASAISDVSGLETGGSQDIDLAEVFSDADGDELTFSAETSDFEVVEAFVFLGTLTVAGLADGTVTITVTAEDADGNTVSDAFDVKVVGPPTPVSGLSCVATTDRVLFTWDAPEWSGAQVYAYDYDLTRPDGGREQARLQGYPAVSARGDWQAGQQASISVKAVYELADGSEVYSEAATLTCTVAE